MATFTPDKRTARLARRHGVGYWQAHNVRVAQIRFRRAIYRAVGLTLLAVVMLAGNAFMVYIVWAYLTARH